MSFKLNRRKFIISTGTGTLIGIASGIPLVGFLTGTGRSTAVDNSVNPSNLLKEFINPSETAHPWVFWYWMSASVSKEGITVLSLQRVKQKFVHYMYTMVR